ncbi:MAG: HAMP domain-containing protein [Solirubrobacterales bacterium]|nr:HAMP domain-containing protein [Solirubrobacterales bacterium]
MRDRTETDLEREIERLSGALASGNADTPGGFTDRAKVLMRAESFGPSARVISISVDGGGTATNQPDLLGQAPQPEGPGSGDDHSSDDHKGGDGHSGGDDDARNLLESPGGLSSVKVDDVGEVRVLTRSVDLPEGNRATIRVGQPLAPVDRALEGLSDTFLIVGLLTLVLAAGAGWLLASSATKPMRRMAGIAEGVGGGDLSDRMPIEETRNDEVRRLAESFNKMLDRLEEAFTRQRAFVADASHDLRTPLTIVKGQLDVLARDPHPTADEVQRVTGIVTVATDRMERLVDDLLLLARTEGESQLNAESTELGPLLAAEMDGFAETENRRFLAGKVTDTAVSIDRELMARVISNLISNAVVHTEPGGAIELSAVDRGGWVVIAVDDDGPGVPPEMRERVFDRFARLDSARSSDSGGSGLGLSIVKALVELHGGSVGCEESPLGGARFTVDSLGDGAGLGGFTHS